MTRPISEIGIDLLILLGSGVFLIYGLIALIAPSLITDLRRKGWNYSPHEDTKVGLLFHRFLGLVFALIGGLMLYGLVRSLF